MDTSSPIAVYLADITQCIGSLSAQSLERAVDLLLEAWRRRARIYVCGNGGSAAIASHFAGDLNKGANVAGRHRFRAMALVDNVPALMAWSNDDGYETAMAEQLRNFVDAGDLVVGISGSGNSPNVLNALQLARDAGAHTLAFCGFDGGRLLQVSDVAVHVPSHSMEQVEDAFSVICHTLLYALRRRIRQEGPADGSLPPLFASAADAYDEQA